FSRALTVARPRPEAPPVTTATLSLTIIDYPFESCCGSEFLRTSETFDDGGVGHARALAHRLQAVATTGGLEVVDEGRQQSGARRAERVTERDRAAPRVELGRVGTEFVGPGERHGRERLVDLVGVDVVDAQTGAGEDLLRGRDRGGEHEDRVVAGDGERVEAGARGQAQLVRHLLAHDERGRRTVGERRGVAGGDDPLRLGEPGRVLLGVEGRLQTGEALGGGGGTQRLVDGVLYLLARGILDGDRDDLLVEVSGLVGRGSTLVRL